MKYRKQLPWYTEKIPGKPEKKDQNMGVFTSLNLLQIKNRKSHRNKAGAEGPVLPEKQPATAVSSRIPWETHPSIHPSHSRLRVSFTVGRIPTNRCVDEVAAERGRTTFWFFGPDRGAGAFTTVNLVWRKFTKFEPNKVGVKAPREWIPMKLTSLAVFRCGETSACASNERAGLIQRRPPTDTRRNSYCCVLRSRPDKGSKSKLTSSSQGVTQGLAHFD